MRELLSKVKRIGIESGVIEIRFSWMILTTI
jgi:hypothetical protein